jgi:hypothetical protein
MKKQKLITIENAKTEKGETLGFLTGIIYMKPDVRTCPFAEKANCLTACLVTAGLAGIYKSINEARERRREFFYSNKQTFMIQLGNEIEQLIKKAKKENLIPVVRLNGTSDIPYETIPYMHYNNIMEAFPEIQFYDYTKISKRLTKKLPSNYDLTFSFSNTEEYKASVDEALLTNTRIAVVFRNGLPETFLGKQVIDGDKHDLRFTEPGNAIVGLKAKGKARSEDSLFIIDTDKLA